jgi:hypothetical protein
MTDIPFLRDATGAPCPARFEANDMILTIHPDAPNAIKVDVRQLLHETSSVDMVKKYRDSSNAVVRLPTSNAGMFAGVHETTDGDYMFTHKGTSIRANTITRATVLRAISKKNSRSQRKEATAPRPPPVTVPEENTNDHSPSPQYSPTSPQYSPTSPQYSPTSPQYPPQHSVNDDDVEFVQERTREQRDEEGRANAIALE